MSSAVVQIRQQPSYRREAFESGLRRLGYSFHEALASPPLAIALRICAEIHIRRTSLTQP